MTEREKDVTETTLGIVREWRGKGSCVVSHPDAGGQCQRPVAKMVWSLPFCEVHGQEAEAAALEEISDDTQMQLEALLSAENARSGSNQLLLHTLGQAETLASEVRVEHFREQDEALRAAYPPLEGHIDSDTLAFDYWQDYACDGPVDWWSEARYLMSRFMRQSHERGLPELVRGLEFLRERACAQLVQAQDDYDRRYVKPSVRARGAERANK